MKTSPSAPSDGTADENALIELYHRRLGTPRHPNEAYGYWIAVFGAIAVVYGVAAIAAAETLPLTALQFRLLATSALLVGAAGPPLILLGFVVRLPLQSLAAGIGGIGALIAISAVVWTVFATPLPLTQDQLLVPGAAYGGGIAVLFLAATVVPLSTRAEPASRSVDGRRAPAYALRETDGEWEWVLYDGDRRVIAESATTFPDRDRARAALERMSVRSPMAGTELVEAE